MVKLRPHLSDFLESFGVLLRPASGSYQVVKRQCTWAPLSHRRSRMRELPIFRLVHVRMLSRRDWRPWGHAAALGVAMKGLSTSISVLLPLLYLSTRRYRRSKTLSLPITLVCSCNLPSIITYHSSQNFHSISGTFGQGVVLCVSKQRPSKLRSSGKCHICPLIHRRW